MSYVIELVVLGASIWAAALYFYFTRNFNHWKAKNVTFIKPVAFFGNIFDVMLLRDSPGVMLADIYKKYAKEKYVGLFLLDKPCLLIRDPKLIKSVLVTNFSSFYNRVEASNSDDPVGCNILFMMKNPEWRELRTKVSPAFSSAKMKDMHRVMQESAAAMLEYVARVAKKDSVIETKELVAKFTTDAITSTWLGVKANCFEHEEAPFRSCSKKLFNWSEFRNSLRMRCYFLAPMLVTLFRMRLFKIECTTFLRDTFSKVMNERMESGNTRNDLIDLLLKLQTKDTKIGRDRLVAQAVQFFLGGTENSSTAMYFALYELARNQNIQDKLRLEINAFYEKEHDFTYDIIKQMTYLDLVMKETLRKYPPISFFQRECNNDFKIPDSDVVIEKGTTVYVSPLGLHYDPEFYPDPEKFIPERFLDHDTKNQTYLPFSDGPRNCMGERIAYLSTKLGLAYILKNFKVEFCEQTNTNLQLNPKALLLAVIGGVRLNYRALNV